MSLPAETFFPFERLLVSLVEHQVDFAVVGGVAVAMNGYVRITEDADILVSDAPENLDRMLGCLRKWGEGYSRELTPADFLPQEGSIRIVEDFPLDVFTRMRGKSLDDFRPRLRYHETAGVRIPFLGPADLIYLKEISWRDKDKLDVAALRALLETPE
jgi:hypothetical protein